MDFIDEDKIELYQELIDEVIAEIHFGIQSGDLEAIEELLRFCPTKNLIGFLPERLHLNFKPLLNE